MQDKQRHQQAEAQYRQALMMNPALNAPNSYNTEVLNEQMEQQILSQIPPLTFGDSGSTCPIDALQHPAQRRPYNLRF